LKSGILVYFNTLRFAFTWLAFAVVFAMACAMVLAVALINVALGRKKYMGFLFHICALLLPAWFWDGLLLFPERMGRTAARAGKIALARAGEIALAPKLFSN
jgi:hypothetical protein